MSDLDYSIVIPVYNSSSSLKELTSKLFTFFESKEYRFEIIFIEDCGPDDSWDVLQGLKEQYKKELKVIKLKKNYGQSGATLCGIENSEGNYIITMDDDLHVSPSDIDKLITTQESSNADLVYGYYGEKEQSIVRNFGSRFINKIIEQSVDVDLRSARQGSSFRLFKNSLKERIQSHKYDFLYLDIILLNNAEIVNFAEVEYFNRKDKDTSYSLFKLIMLTIKIVFYYPSLSFRLMTFSSLILGSITGCTLLYLFIMRTFFASEPIDLPFTITFSLSVFIVSFLLLLFVITYKKEIKTPPYQIDQKY